MVVGDSDRLRQVLVNLAGNAIKFTEKGSVSILIDAVKGASSELIVRFRIQDTGIGFPKEKLKKLFQPFTQADSSTTRKYGGTGLGLDISKKLVELMGGEIQVESQDGAGSCFYFNLPMKQEGEIMPLPPVKSSETKTEDSIVPMMVPAVGNTRRVEKAHSVSESLTRILLVEDHPDNQLLVQAYLRSGPFKVETVENGKIALESFQKNRYDLVLMDLHMPIMDGYAAVRLMRKW